MANTRTFNARANASRKRKKLHNPLAGLMFSDFGMSAPQASVSSSALIRSESLSEDRRRVTRTEMPVAVPSHLGQQPFSPAKISGKISEVAEVMMEPLRYPGDEVGSSEKKERVERVGRETSVCSQNFILLFQN